MITNNRIHDENIINAIPRRKHIKNIDCCIIIIQYVILTALNICLLIFTWNYIMVIDMLNNYNVASFIKKNYTPDYYIILIVITILILCCQMLYLTRRFTANIIPIITTVCIYDCIYLIAIIATMDMNDCLKRPYLDCSYIIKTITQNLTNETNVTYYNETSNTSYIVKNITTTTREIQIYEPEYPIILDNSAFHMAKQMLVNIIYGLLVFQIVFAILTGYNNYRKTYHFSKKIYYEIILLVVFYNISAFILVVLVAIIIFMITCYCDNCRCNEDSPFYISHSEFEDIIFGKDYTTITIQV